MHDVMGLLCSDNVRVLFTCSSQSVNVSDSCQVVLSWLHLWLTAFYWSFAFAFFPFLSFAKIGIRFLLILAHFQALIQNGKLQTLTT